MKAKAKNIKAEVNTIKDNFLFRFRFHSVWIGLYNFHMKCTLYFIFFCFYSLCKWLSFPSVLFFLHGLYLYLQRRNDVTPIRVWMGVFVSIGRNMYTCVCLNGYTGTNCEIGTSHSDLSLLDAAAVE